MKKKIFLTVLFIVLYLTAFDLFVEGPTGLSAKMYACLGKELRPEQIWLKKMPRKTFSFRYPFNFRYAVNANDPIDVVYCFGKNIQKIR